MTIKTKNITKIFNMILLNQTLLKNRNLIFTNVIFNKNSISTLLLQNHNLYIYNVCLKISAVSSYPL